MSRLCAICPRGQLERSASRTFFDEATGRLDRTSAARGSGFLFELQKEQPTEAAGRFPRHFEMDNQTPRKKYRLRSFERSRSRTLCDKPMGTFYRSTPTGTFGLLFEPQKEQPTEQAGRFPQRFEMDNQSLCKEDRLSSRYPIFNKGQPERSCSRTLSDEPTWTLEEQPIERAGRFRQRLEGEAHSLSDLRLIFPNAQSEQSPLLSLCDEPIKKVDRTTADRASGVFIELHSEQRRAILVAETLGEERPKGEEDGLGSFCCIFRKRHPDQSPSRSTGPQ